MEESFSYAYLLLDNRAEHGEGPVWDETNQILYWVDMTACRLHQLDPQTGETECHQFIEPACAVAPMAENKLLIAFAKRLVTVNLTTKSIQEICAVEPDLPDNRCNDGKIDPNGKFWIGTMSNDGTIRGVGSLYRLDDGKLTKVLGDLTIANGMEWTKDAKTMFFIDTPTREVWAFDFDPNNSSISNRRTVVQVPKKLGFPDGMTVASDNTLWVAHWGAGCVCQWDPKTGELLQRIITNCPQTSSCCFGGADGQDLFITTSRLGMDENDIVAAPHSGSLYSYRQSK